MFDRLDAEVLRTGEPDSLEWRIPHPTGRQPWGMEVKSRLTMPDGRRFLIEALVDITTQKEAVFEADRSR